MTMPLVQLGPGGDYVRSLVPDGDRLTVVAHSYGSVRPVGGPARRPSKRSPIGSIVARFLRWCGLREESPARAEDVATSELDGDDPGGGGPRPDGTTSGHRIQPSAARPYHRAARRPGQGRTERHARLDEFVATAPGAIGRLRGIDRVELSRSALDAAGRSRAAAIEPEHPPLRSPGAAPAG
ncbi:MAG: hypothetical protein VX726_06500, partial [Planctomycetota bacterium]|nr:hypothetical protein [Planctomycetota bacterium]